MKLSKWETLPSKEDLMEKGYPFGMATEGIPFGDRKNEFYRTRPDVLVFCPNEIDRYDNDNEHFLVFESPDKKELLATWTQSSCEGRGDNHLMLSRSTDGENWSTPKRIVGTDENREGEQASWGFPIVNASGRIYLFFTWERKCEPTDRQGSGAMGCCFSDDCGNTWSEIGEVAMPRSKFDHPDLAYEKNWIVWQNVVKDGDGKPVAFCTQCTSQAYNKRKEKLAWVNRDSRCFFIRFENLDENPRPSEVKTTWLPEDDEGITVPNPLFDGMSVAQEPSMVLLPNGDWFAVMRTMTGFIYYTVSKDGGKTWRKPAVLFMEDGKPFLHPLSPCPIYALKDGRFLILFHNNNGIKGRFNQFEKVWDCNYANYVRNPTYVCVGTFCEGEQPISFGKPKKLLDTDDVAVGPKKTAEVGTYPSITEWNGKRMLWYPDRKFYLLGKELTDEFLQD